MAKRFRLDPDANTTSMMMMATEKEKISEEKEKVSSSITATKAEAVMIENKTKDSSSSTSEVGKEMKCKVIATTDDKKSMKQEAIEAEKAKRKSYKKGLRGHFIL